MTSRGGRGGVVGLRRLCSQNGARFRGWNVVRKSWRSLDSELTWSGWLWFLGSVLIVKGGVMYRSEGEFWMRVEIN